MQFEDVITLKKKEVPLRMIARDRLVEIDGQFFFGETPYSGAAFSVDSDKNFSAIIMESGAVIGPYRPLTAPKDRDYPQIDMTDGMDNDMDGNYIFPNEAMQPSTEPHIHGVGYYIYNYVNEYYFDEVLSSEVAMWDENGTMIYSPNIKKDEYIAKFSWNENQKLNNISFMWPENDGWININRINYQSINVELACDGAYEIRDGTPNIVKYKNIIKMLCDLFDYIPDGFFEKIKWPD